MNDVSIPKAMTGKRSSYLDHLKVFLTFLVIMHHTAQAYGPTGGAWVYQDPGPTSYGLAGFITVNASFFMGLFFLISGYFLPRSFDGAKISTFLWKKTKRLLFPVLGILLLVVPVYFYAAMTYRGANTYDFFTFYIKSYFGDGLLSYEHGWYMMHLFLYAVIYAGVRVLLKKRVIQLPAKVGLSAVLGLGLLIGLLSFLVRMVFPIDNWIDLLGFIGLEPAHLPQYALMLIVGILAYRAGWFDTMSRKVGIISIAIGIIMAAIVWAKDLPVIHEVMTVIWNVWPFYESVMAVSLSFGLLIVFREFFHRENRFMKILGQSAFSAYVIHNLFVVLLQLLFDKVGLDTTVKFFLVSALAIFLSFGSAYVYVRLAGLFRTKCLPRSK